VGSVVADDVAGGETRPLLFLGIANNTGGTITFTPAANRLETVTAPTNLPASSTGDVAGTTFSTGDQATLRGMLNAAMHAIARDRWLGSLTFTPSAANNYGAYDEPVAGLDVAVRKHLDYITVGEDSSSSYGSYNRDDYASDDLLLAAVIAALPAAGGTVYIKPGFTLDNFAADVSIPASARITFASDKHRHAAAATFDMGVYGFVCASGGTNGQLIFEKCTWSSTSATTDGNVIELHDNFDFVLRDCAIKLVTTRTAAPSAFISVNAAVATPGTVLIDNCDFDYQCEVVNTTTSRFVFDCSSTTAVLDDVLITNSRFSVKGDISAIYNGIVVNIQNVGSHVRVEDCEFVTPGGQLGSGDLLICVNLEQYTPWASLDTIRRHVTGCAFSGGNILGVYVSNARSVRVLNNQATTIRKFVEHNITTAFPGTTVDLLVQGNSVVGLTNSLGATMLALSGNEDHDGIRVEDNYFSGTIDVSKATNNLYNFTFRNNTVYESAFIVDAQNSLTGIHVDGNTFQGDESVAAPLIGSSTIQVNDVTFTRNTVKGYFTSVLPDFVFGFHVVASHIDQVRVEGNHFDSLQSDVTYIGTNPVDQWAVIRLVYDTGDSIVIDGNSFDHISANNGVSGPGVLRDVTLFKLDSVTPNAYGDVGATLICNNTMGDILSSVTILGARGHNTMGMQFCNNSLQYARGLITPGSSACVTIDRANNIGALGGTLKFSGNTLDRRGSASHFISLTGNDPFHFSVVSILDNVFLPNASLTNRGIELQVVHDSFVLDNNVALTFGMVIDLATAGLAVPGTNVLPSTFPAGTGAAIDDNLKFTTYI
jgi:hypothetical protein